MPSVYLTAGFAVGVVLHLLLMVLARASRRALHELFFYLFGALFLWHAGNLLALFVAHGPAPGMPATGAGATFFARALAFSGLAVLSPLLVHVHLEYAQSRLRWYAGLFYLPLLFAPWGIRAAALAQGIPRGPWTDRFILYFSAALVISATINLRLAGRAQRGHLAIFHYSLAGLFVGLAVACVYAFLLAPPGPAAEVAQYLLLLSSIAPSALVGYWVFRFNFLEAGAQRAVALGMLGLLGVLVYALVISRIGSALERRGYAPSVVTEALLVFCFVVLAEPVFRRFRGWLSQQMSAELSRLEEVRAELQERALHLPPGELRAFAEERISAFFEFPVRVREGGELEPAPGRSLKFREAGSLRVLAAHTAEALERSRHVTERTQLERELAEREKMAALGEMAAFIAHRLKNPLSAIHTLVQLIGEQSPAAAEHCAVIRGEIRRLNTAVSDLLRFTAPAEAARPAGSVRACEALQEAVALFSPEAARKGVQLEWHAAPEVMLPIAPDALHDLLTSLLGNALDAAPERSRVVVSCSEAKLAVEDEGPGVAPEHCERIFDPFFTLKPGGTGLGLALARRRATEAGAQIRCVSPARNGRGARFEVVFSSADGTDGPD